METNQSLGFGWLKDYPDIRDFTIDTDVISKDVKKLGKDDTVKAMLKKAGIGDKTITPPTSVDLRKWCSPVENQGSLGSCTAHAGVGMIEYYERRAFGTHIDASRLFLYKASRNLLKWTGDTGAYLRTTMGAIALFGVPPESYYPYNVAKFDEEPSAFLYAFGQSYQAITYYRLDPLGAVKTTVLANIKNHLACGFPFMFGFTCYSSLDHAQTEKTGCIPFPGKKEKVVGGHAIMAVGFDDAKKIKNPISGEETTGAVLIRNSWGTTWGEAGYGWLPYQYFLTGLADDCWCLLKKEYLDTGQFGLPV